MLLRAASLLALLLAAPAAGAAQERSEAFLDLASRLPAPLLDGSGEPAYAQLHFADHAAAERVLAALPTAAPHVEAHGAFARLLTPLFVESLGAGVEGGWPPLVGFGPSDIRTSLAVEAPPLAGMILRLDPAAAPGVAPSLEAAGYAPQTRDGVAALARGEDAGTDLAARDPADPFGRRMGAASRVGLEGDLLVQANAWPLLSDLLGAAPQGHADLPALAAALDDPAWGEALLVQAAIWPDQDLLGAHGEPGLPPWRLALLADLAEGTGTLTLLLLSYPDRAQAEAAAATLEAGWAELPAPSGRSLREITGSPAEVTVLGEGPYVTALALRAPSDTLQGGWPVNRPFHRLLLALGHRDLELLGPS